jgi:hypothetical protein
MKFSRRDLLAWGAGAAAGLMVTPVPWKVLDDVSIWSQNWGWIPQPAKGPVEVKQSFCTLCPKGCGLRVRMAGGWAVGIAGMSRHPLTRGALCPLAFGAHQLNWHPRRLREVWRRGARSSWDEARSALKKAVNEGPMIVVDGYPGRAGSAVMKEFAQAHKGEYRVVLPPETRALKPLESWTGVPSSSLGYDLENTKTVLSFGAPLLDGWGIPGRFTRLWAERAASSNDPQLRLIQVDSSLSRTAARAWRWISIREGTESALASGLARALIEQKLVPARGPIPSMTISEAARRTGLREDSIQSLARTLVERQPALAIAGDENPAVAALNVLLGTVGAPGGIVLRSKEASTYASADEPMPNARAVVLDSSVPWDFDPQTDGEVFRSAGWDGGATKADWLLPAPGFLEETTDVPTAPTATVETYGIAAGLVKPTVEVTSAAQFLASIDSSLPPTDTIIHGRCEDLWRKKTGSLCGKDVIPLTQYETAQKLEEELRKGSVWMGDAWRGTLPCRVKDWPAGSDEKSLERWTTSWPVPVLPSLATKLYLESNLREAPFRRDA